MGLALCRRIVGIHGGTIWAAPRIGRQSGLAVHVTLPADGPRIGKAIPEDQEERPAAT